ncbi:MAG: DNA polymerase III subunit gamma/tau [Nitrospinaceae bacterium]
MEFQVSARKWRPQKFSELVGQEHIVRTLTNAIALDRVSHAYLFSGTRGVGKTTTARILAKAINCVQRTETEPCDECSACLEIRVGNSIDVQEIDGASNNGVAEVRDLIENVQYATSSLQYKVYIIDEVHMLSKSAFNALLKTLEEPPPRVIFIFATTELNKIPETILSRCQCFEFKPLPHKQIIRQLELICDHDKIRIDRLSLEEIAKNGAGSMRDAQSLLDQVVAYCGKEITSGSVEAVLGIVGQKALETFIDHVVARDPAALMNQIQQVANSGKDLNAFCRDLAEFVRNLMIVKVAADPAALLDAHTRDLDVLGKQAETFHNDELQQMFALLSRTETEMKRSSLAKMVFEMAVLRLTDIRPFRSIDETLQKINAMEQETVGGPDRGQPSQPVMQEPGNQPATLSAAAVSPPAHETSPAKTWDRVKKEICRRKAFLGHYLTVTRIIHLGPSALHLEISDPYTKERLEQEDHLQIIRSAAQTVCGREMEIRLSLNTGEDTPPGPAGENYQAENPSPASYNKLSQKTQTEIIQEALDIFGGVVIR